MDVPRGRLDVKIEVDGVSGVWGLSRVLCVDVLRDMARLLVRMDSEGGRLRRGGLLGIQGSLTLPLP